MGKIEALMVCLPIGGEARMQVDEGDPVSGRRLGRALSARAPPA